MVLTAQNHKRALESTGFEVISTGGGFYAWHRRFPGGHSILVTNIEDGHEFDSDAAHAVVCSYDQDHQQVGEAWEGPLSDAAGEIELQLRATLLRSLPGMDKTQIVMAARDAAARSIQNALGVTTGDTAGLFFTGAESRAINSVLTKYLDFELATITASIPDTEDVSSGQRPTSR